MSQIVFFLEEPSAEEMLKGFLPKLLPENIHFRCVTFEGKQDLEKQVERKLRAWNIPNSKFIVLRDQDSADCKLVKSNLLNICARSGKEALIRIACHELEAWYLGDLTAVEKAIGPSNIARHQNKAKFRDPDTINNAAEELKKIAPSYAKRSGSRKIGPFLDIDNNKSESFNVFVSGIRKIVGEFL